MEAAGGVTCTLSLNDQDWHLVHQVEAQSLTPEVKALLQEGLALGILNEEMIEEMDEKVRIGERTSVDIYQVWAPKIEQEKLVFETRHVSELMMVCQRQESFAALTPDPRIARWLGSEFMRVYRDQMFQV